MTPLYWWAWASSRWIFKNLFRCRVYNPERVPIIGPVIIAANHESYFDPPFIGSSLPRPINYLARENIFSHWLSGLFFRGLNAVPVDREGGGARGLKIILERLLKDNGIIIFPEGTRTFDGEMLPAQGGIGLTIIKSRAGTRLDDRQADAALGRQHFAVERPRAFRKNDDTIVF